MGLFSSEQKTESESKSQLKAADFVQPYLEDSTAAYGSLETPEAYTGDWQAGLNPMLGGAWQNMYGPSAIGNQIANQSMYANNAGLYGLNNLNQGFQYDQGVYDQTMQNLQPAMQGTYDDAVRGNNRDLNWNTLTGIDLASSMSGQQGGTKNQQNTALAQGMTADRNADVASQIYQNATNQANTNAMTAGQQSLNAYGQAAGLGMQNMGLGFDIYQQGLQNQLAAGQGYQNYAQQGADFDRAAWDQNQQNPWLYEAQRLGNLSNTGAQFGEQTSSSNSTSTSDPGLGNIAMQAAAAYFTGGASLGAGGLMGGGSGGAGAPSFQSAPIGYNQPQYNLGITPNTTTGYNY